MDDASDKSLRNDERVVPESEVRQMQQRIKQLERLVGKQAMHDRSGHDQSEAAGKSVKACSAQSGGRRQARQFRQARRCRLPK